VSNTGLADDKMAENLASEVIHASTDFHVKERAPMRLAEARITLGVVAARQGDLDEAVSQGEHALSGQHRSLPSLLMASRDLTKLLNERYPGVAGTRQYLDQFHALSASPGRPN